MKTIKVTMVNGKPVIETSGFTGDACVRATEALERNLSGEGGVEVRDTRPGVEEETQKQYAGF